MTKAQATKKPSKSGKASQTDATAKAAGMSKIVEEDEHKLLADDDINSGFGNYLRSQEGMEMMKLFVMANTMLVFVTVAWPSIKESIYIIRDYFFDES